MTDPQAPPAFYSRRYFTERCGGCTEFAASGGAALDSIRAAALDLLAPRTGERIMDLGCGRGELAVALASRGCRVIALDFSLDALAIARETARRQRAAIHLIRARAELLPIRGAGLDAVLATDIVEHLPDRDLIAAVSEVHRALVPAGRFIVHTAPTRAFMAIGQHVNRFLQWARRETVAPLLTYASELREAGHSNIHSRRSLRAALASSFASPRVFYAFSDPARPGRGIAARLGLASILGFNLWAVARRVERI